MLAKRIIPCLDVRDGKVVKGVQFKNHVIVGDIAELAEYYSKQGADELVFYDITASADRRDTDYQWVKAISKCINIPFTVGGGIKTIEQIQKILHLGADKVSLNSPALERPDFINESVQVFGSQCIVIGMDSRYSVEDDEDYVYKYTGSEKTSEKTRVKTLDWVQEVVRRGAGEIVMNSMNTDGVRDGFDIRLLKKIEAVCPIPLIASGGAGTREHFAKVFHSVNIDGALAASVFHSREIKIPELKKYLAEEGIAMREVSDSV